MNTLKKLAVPILFVLLLVFSFLLRSQMLLHGDFYYLLDQSRDMLLTKSIVIDHKLALIGARTGLGGLFHGPLWLYIIAPFFILAKGNPYLTLMPLFEIVNLAIIVAGFFVGWRLYGKWVGLLFALLLTISSTLVDTVPFTSNAQVLPTVFLLYLYAIIEFMRGKDTYFIAALFFAGLGFQFESAFAVLLIPLTSLAILLKWSLPAIKSIILGIVAFLFAVSTFILFDLRHKFLMTRSALQLFTNHVKPLSGYEQYANIGFRLNDRITNLWNSIFTPLFSKDTFTSLLLGIILVLGIAYLLKEVVTKKKLNSANKEYVFILLSPVIIFGIYVFYPLPLWPHYLLPIAALSTCILVMSIKNIWTNIYTRILVITFLLVATVPAVGWVKSNYIDAPAYQPSSDGSYRNQLQVAQWVLADTHNKPYGYFVYTTGILTYNMDYLLWWLSYRNNLIIPSNQKHKITYLIMYPHATDDAHAYNFWKKNVLRTNGEILLTKIFSSGITVQKLDISSAEQPVDPNYYSNLLFR